MLKVNFGCGLNKLPGWRNLDSEVDIAKPLPFADASVDFILCEHCVEHIAYYAVIDFFAECHRILKPGGTVRISVPSLEQIWKHGTKDYYEFTERWQKVGPTARGAMEAILYAHGHAGGWTATLLEATLYFSGFEAIEQCQPHRSRHVELCNVDGHHKMIGEKFNAIESCIYEATK